ncbi:hypothetical protein [Halobacillus trueperi]|uniref:hypothetical protein n=1 Tax=Halobacillus trueperi TaxID=156205 RepID=UPI0015F27B84|nr:hypothetical protein [Halobacillus trueperi]
MMKFILYAGMILANIRAVHESTENMILMFFVSAAAIVILKALIKNRQNTYF